MEVLTLKDIVESGVNLTPMMEQYYSIKKEYPDTLVFFRMGDFYELFFEDARRISSLLNITLTHRGKLGDTPIPMAGIPHHAASNYIDRLTTQGLKVVICEQIEDPKDAVGIVKRAVTQVASPGMPFDLDRSDATEHRYIASAYKSHGKFVAIYLDFTTGDFCGHTFDLFEDLLQSLAHYAPKEFITYFNQWQENEKLVHYLKLKDILVTHLSEDYFKSKNTEIYLEKAQPGIRRDKYLKMVPEAFAPMGAICYYVFSTQGANSLIHLRPFQLLTEKNKMRIAHSTLLSLEMLPKNKDESSYSLIGFMNRTITAIGDREFKNFFQKPSADLSEIKKRQMAVKFFYQNQELSDSLSVSLKNIRDIQRILAKVATKKCSAQDLLGLSLTLQNYYKLIDEIAKQKPSADLWSLLSPEEKNRKDFLKLAEEIVNTINDELGATLEKGNLIKFGVSKERDKLWKLCQNTEEEVAKLEEKYRKKSGISKLKIKSNNINGLFIEISKAQGEKVPASFKRFQTLVNAERFTTADLETFEKELLSAKEKLQRIETSLFTSLVTCVCEKTKELQEVSWSISQIDIFLSLAKVAFSENFVCPDFQKNKIVELAQCWHPLIKTKSNEQFIPHDIRMDENNFFGLITGPNMAGKTTVMREVAICQALAQMGSFIPAKFAKLSICDSIFCRIGASDDIIRGQSTFMIEMSEASEIIRHATDRSLVILDELGRGTSTYDGLSLAWALVDHFVYKIKCFTFFATHYHELIEVVNNLPNAKNFCMETKVDREDVHFQYRFIEGGVAQSYGIFVAKLAGIPQDILSRAKSYLKQLEYKQSDEKIISKNNKISDEFSPEEIGQLDLFSSLNEQTLKSCEQLLNKNDQIFKDLQKIDLNQITPIDALLKLREIKESFCVKI